MRFLGLTVAKMVSNLHVEFGFDSSDYLSSVWNELIFIHSIIEHLYDSQYKCSQSSYDQLNGTSVAGWIETLNL